MGRLTGKRCIKHYHRIYEVISTTPTIPFSNLSIRIKLSRNTISKYVKDMYERSIIRGPEIRMKSSPDYKEYVYLMRFSHPASLFTGLKGFPNVLYHAVASGDWNTFVITDRLLDFSQLKGFEKMVYRGVKYTSYTPRTEYITWNDTFEKVYDELIEFSPRRSEDKTRELAPLLQWGEDEWELFHSFKNDFRKSITPILRKTKVRYETYYHWMKSLENHCTIHTGFYPQGYTTYLSHCFLLFSDYEYTVKTIFSLFHIHTFHHRS